MRKSFNTESYIAAFLANGGTIKQIPSGKKAYTDAQMRKATMQPRTVFPKPMHERFAPAPLIAQELANA